VKQDNQQINDLQTQLKKMKNENDLLQELIRSFKAQKIIRERSKMRNYQDHSPELAILPVHMTPNEEYLPSINVRYTGSEEHEHSQVTIP
jgi:hypothetical protein